MSIKSIALAAVAVVLAYLVYLDYGADESESPTKADLGSMEKVQKLVGVVNAEQAIINAYGRMSLPYAELMALMDTFVVKKGDPGVQLDGVVRKLADQYDVTVDQLNIGAPQLVGDGVFLLQADVEMSSWSSHGLWSLFLALSESQRGFSWHSFKLRAVAEERKILLSGQLMALLVQAVE